VTESVVLCYAAADEVVARYLAEFIGINLAYDVSCDEAIVGPKLDLMEATELALSAQAALVLLSPSSVPQSWDRKVWEPLFFEKPKEFQTLLGFVLVSDCKFPASLRRERFFDASGDAPGAAREIKRWLLRPHEVVRPPTPVAPELRSVLDRPGKAVDVDVELAVRFAEDCADDFEAVYRLDCRGRSRTGITGDIRSALGLGNPAAFTDWCADHRVLFVLAGVSTQDRDHVAPGGRASVIFTGPTEGALPGSVSNGAGEAVGRFHNGLRVDVAEGLRLGWVAVGLLKALERIDEVSEVLAEMATAARNGGDLNALSKIEREQFWIGDSDVPERPLSIAEGEQLRLPFA
jgi:hypothetical protein